MESPLSRAWAALTRYPALVLVPLVWEAVGAAVGWLLVREPIRQTGRTINVKFLLPSTLPTGGELLGTAPSINLAPGSVALIPGMLFGLIMMLIGAFVTAGFLHLLVGTLDEIPPSWDRFVEGVNRFGGRLLLWNLLIGIIMLIAVFLAVGLSPVAVVLGLVGLAAAILLLLVPYLIVVDDLSVGEALSQSPSRVMAEFGSLLMVAVVSLLLSAAFSWLLSVMNLRTLWIASPLWAFFGTFITLAVVAVIRPQPPASEA